MNTEQKNGKSILIISDINIDSGFGKEYVVYNFAKEISNRYHVILFESNKGDPKNNYNEELITKGVNVRFFDNLFGSFFPYSLIATKTLISLLKTTDMVYLAESDLFTDILITILRKFFKFKVFRGYHNPLHYELLPNGKKISKYSARNLYYRLILRLEKGFDGIHVENSDHKEALLEMGYKKIVLTHPYVLSNISSSQPTKFNEFSIIFLGRLNYHKGSDLIPQIINSINNLGIKFHAYVAGDGILYPKIREFCSNNENCIFLGYITSKERDSYLSKCHILIAPTRVEAFMIAGIEAMAFGTPVISFPVPGPNDYIRDGLNGFIAKNVEELSQRVKIVYSDFVNGDYQKYMVNCLETASEYTLDAGKGKYIELIEKLMN